MRKVLIDTALLAIPNYAEVGADADRLIDRITHFSQLALPDVPIDMLLLDGFEDALWGKGAGPEFFAIRDFLELMDLADIYSAQDLYKQYTYLMDVASSASEHCEPLIVNCSTIEVMPNLPDSLFPSGLKDETMRVLAQLCYVNSDEEQTNWMFGSSLCSEGLDLFQISAEIDQVSHDGCSVQPVSPPIKATASVPTFNSIEDLISIGAALDLWTEAEDANALHLSIAMGAIALRRSAGKDSEISTLKKFSIGSEFFSSLCAHQCSRNARFSKTTARICMEIVAECYPANIGKMGKPSQTKRPVDDALAFRLHVTGGGVGLRLMFWEGAGLFEFANVGPKHELVIETGHAPSSVKSDFTNVV